jgi:hypothetical protein
LSYPETLAKKDLILNVVYDKDDDGNFFQYKFEVHWPLKENIVAKYEYLEQHVLSQLTSFVTNRLHFKKVCKQAMKITLARYFPDRAEWRIIQPSRTTSAASGAKKNKTSNVSSKANLKLEPYRLNDLTVIGVLEGDHLSIADFDTNFDKMQRTTLERDKEEKRSNRERNRTDNDRNQQNGSSGRRRSPQNTMRINVDDFDID